MPYDRAIENYIIKTEKGKKYFTPKFILNELSNESAKIFRKRFIEEYIKFRTLSANFNEEITSEIICEELKSELKVSFIGRYHIKVNKKHKLYEIMKNTHGKLLPTLPKVEGQKSYRELSQDRKNLRKLAKKLAKNIKNDKRLTTSGPFKTFHKSIVTEIIDTDKFIFKESFATSVGLRASVKKFREMFVEEYFQKPNSKIKKAEIVKTLSEIKIRNSRPFTKLPDQNSMIPNNVLSRKNFENVEQVLKLAKTLAQRVRNKEPIFLEDEVETYFKGLVETVFDVENDKFREDFVKDKILSPPVKMFREIFLAEYFLDLSSRIRTPEDKLELESEMLEIKLNLHEDFEITEKRVVTDVDVEIFFKKLVFTVNQPNIVQLTRIITRELAENSRFNSTNAKLAYASLQKEMLDWFKEKKGRWLSLDNCKCILNRISDEINAARPREVVDEMEY